jgi:CRISPR-associated protein Csb2
MAAQLCLSVVLLDRSFHGRTDGGVPEWPPSPLRLFQALLATAGRQGEAAVAAVAPALRWLEGLGVPVVVAPAARPGVPVRIAVPNNDLDVVAADWARGRTPKRQPAELKTMKSVCPVQLLGGDTVRFLWSLAEGADGHVETLSRLARSVVALGWGMDLVAADACVLSREEADALVGERWRPVASGGVGLRVPREGTFQELRGRHEAFLGRLPESGGFVPVPPLTAFEVVGYRREGAVTAVPFAAFAILRGDASGYRPYDTVRFSRTVAGMVRHATVGAARDAGRSEEWVNAFVHGHTPDGNARARGAGADERFMFLPLPTISPLRVESVRRVLVVAPPGCEGEVAWACRYLSGRELIREDNGEGQAVLSLLPVTDPQVRRYTDEAEVWSTVTPVILPGHEARNEVRTLRMIRSAFRQSGWPDELVARAEIVFRPTGFRAGVAAAREYRPSAHQANYPRCHVRVSWRDGEGRPVAVPGPICVGAGRYHGLGLFAAE